MSVTAILYDDKRSYLHTVLGFLSLFYPKISIVFCIYEVLEYYIVRENKDFQHTLGDFCEFSLGLLFAVLSLAILSLF